MILAGYTTDLFKVQAIFEITSSALDKTSSYLVDQQKVDRSIGQNVIFDILEPLAF